MASRLRRPALFVALVTLVIVPVPAFGTVRVANHGPTAQDSSPVSTAWVARFPHPPGSGSASALTVGPSGAVFVGGTTRIHGKLGDSAVGYDPATGARRSVATSLLGSRDDSGGSFTVFSPDGGTLFVATSRLTSGGYESRFVVFAFDSSTGATRWTSSYGGPLAFDRPQRVVLSPDGSRLYVTGVSVGENGYGVESITLAYETATGARRWVGHYLGPAADAEPAAIAVSPNGSQVFLAGSSFGWQGRRTHVFTIAYDAATGSQSWIENLAPGGSVRANPAALQVSPDSAEVYVTGAARNSNTGPLYLATVAYRTSTGSRSWTRLENGAGSPETRASDIGVSPDGTRVFVTGAATGATMADDFATFAYDAITGSTLWRSRYAGPNNAQDVATALAVSPSGSTVVVTGQSSGSATGPDLATIAYDAATGRRLWMKRYTPPGMDHPSALVFSRDGSQLFVAGDSWGGSSQPRWVVIAYNLP
jgi:hypothetical protein